MKRILSILLVLVLGWKNGVLIGATSGVTIGATLGIIAEYEPSMVAAFAISGMMSGLLNRFGKIGVIVGFTLGNVVLAYVSNGYTVELIHFKEILIASIGLLAVPKTLEIPIEEFDIKTLSFTYGDSMPTFSQAIENKKEYHNQIYTYDEILKIIDKFGLPQNWNDDGKYGYERYIEVQVWNEEPINRYKNKKS